jgi:hypothetical protein
MTARYRTIQAELDAADACYRRSKAESCELSLKTLRASLIRTRDAEAQWRWMQQVITSAFAHLPARCVEQDWSDPLGISLFLDTEIRTRLRTLAGQKWK